MGEQVINSRRSVKFKMPHIYVILFIFIAIMAILTHIVPAGEYNRVLGPNGSLILDPDSYHRIPQRPVGVLDFFIALPKGFVEAGWVVVMTFCVGGAFVVVKKTGVIHIGVDILARKLSRKGIIIIPVLMTLFAIIDCFIGMPELCMVYVPVILPLALALGFDSITAAAIALCGSAAGFTAALTNPFTIGIAQKIAGLPLYSGVGYRIITLIVTLSIGILFVMRYAMKIRKQPKLSSMYELDILMKDKGLDNNQKIKVERKHFLAGFSAASIFIIMVFGVLVYKWEMPQMGGIFIAMSVVSGKLGGLSGDEICEAFTEGCQNVLVGALIVGIARGITVILDQGMIMDTIIHFLGVAIQGLPSAISAVGMLIVQSLFNFLVPSGSGQALITMPIMSPLADIVGITKQTAVLALQYGDGISNIFYPTSGFFIASLALAGVPWQKWAKFMLPLFLIWLLVGAVFIVIAQMINWGPF